MSSIFRDTLSLLIRNFRLRSTSPSESALLASQACQDSILAASPDTITILNLETQVLSVSPAAMKMFRCEESVFIGHPVTNFLILSDRTRAVENMQLMFQGVMVGPTEYTALRPDLSQFPIEANAEFIRDEKGQPCNLVVVVRDISERKQLEKTMQQLESQLQQAQKMESLGSLAGGVAHDMNNVLGAITALSSAHMSQLPEESSIHHCLDTILKAAERGGKLVRSLLDFARQTLMEEQVLYLNSIVREEVNLLEQSALKNIDVKLDLGGDLHPIKGDPNALNHVIMNLCINAADAMPSGGKLTLSTSNLNSEWVQLQIQDTGSGMSTETLQRAMEPFFTTKAPGKGTGLGLSLAYSTIKAHRGRMDIQSEEGKGTCIQLSFPAHPLHAYQPKTAKGLENNQTGLKIMLVDDDKLILSAFEAVLKALGHHPIPVGNGEDALKQLAREEDIHAVILDVNMPGMGGAATLPRIREMRPDLPIILATGRSDQSTLELLQANPGVQFLPKPFGMTELRKCLDHLQQPAFT